MKLCKLSDRAESRGLYAERAAGLSRAAKRKARAAALTLYRVRKAERDRPDGRK